MDFERVITDEGIIIYCDKVLYSFSKEFMNYYKQDILRIKKVLSLDLDINIIFALFSNSDIFGDLPYESNSFAGFFNDTGVTAYVNEYGNYTKDDLFKRLIHESVHFLYENYVYGKDKERITWVDEGLAQFISNQRKDLEKIADYMNFVVDNIVDFDLNQLNHDDRSFGNNNGYNLAYIAIRYLYESNSHEMFLNIIKDEKYLKSIGSSILKEARKFYLKEMSI